MGRGLSREGYCFKVLLDEGMDGWDLVVWVVDWFGGCLVGWLADWLVNWLAGFCGWLVPWLTG